MNKIYIEHNPFIVETRFLINGREPAEGCKISGYKEARLQLWVESLFSDLQALLNGETEFEVVFKGVESDFIDIQDAAGAATAQGIIIKLHWQPVKATDDRLDEIRFLMDQARANPQFRAYFENHEQVRTDFREAFNRDFNVYVVATLSSGKSTLINAMLGQDLLPAANEATTAAITQITDDKTLGGAFYARRLNIDGSESAEEREISGKMLREWNCLPDTKRIELRGNIVSMQAREHVRLVLTDTPGPNNSLNAEHERTTMSFIQDSSRNPLILYVMNATQLGTYDDKYLLGLVAQTMKKGGKQSKDRFIFVINKMDNFDPEKGENVGAALGNVKRYLESNGIRNPLVYPISANLARLLRKDRALLTAKERNDLHTMTELFLEQESMNFPEYMPLTSRVRRSLGQRNLTEIIQRSGVPAVEVMIDEYIDKYTFPNRLKRAYDALTRAIELGMKETQLLEQLQRDEYDLALINDEIARLETRHNAGMNTAAYKERVRREGKGLPADIADTFAAEEVKVRGMLKSLTDYISSLGDIKPNMAERELNSAERQVKFAYKELINEFEMAFQAAQQYVKDELHEEYLHFISAIFEDSRKLSLPMLQGLKESAEDIALNLSLTPRDIKKKEEKFNPREVSLARWYNPFSWGRKRTIYDYRTIEYVDMLEVWKEKRTLIESNFNTLRTSALEKIEEDKNKLVESYLAFIEREFNEKFSRLIAALKARLTHKETREQAIAAAKVQQKWIAEFKTRLDNILTI